MLVYIDTNVLMDLLLDRKNVFGKSLGDRAAILIEKVVECEHYIVVSDWTVKELRRNGVNEERIAMLLGFIGKKIRTISADENDEIRARKLDPDNISDALHVVLALKAGADVIATRNLRDFLKYRHLIRAELPENL